MRRIFSLAAAAAMALAAMPVVSPRAEGPWILSGYKSMSGPSGRPRDGAHPAVDFGGRVGDPIFAAADGRVHYAETSRDCGMGIWLLHAKFNRYTLYCHLSRLDVRRGDDVKRGQVIGLLGATGEPTWRARGGVPIAQLHFQLADSAIPRGDGHLEGTYDPIAFTIGCFDPAKRYPTDRLVLTYPVQCR